MNQLTLMSLKETNLVIVNALMYSDLEIQKMKGTSYE